MTDREIMIHRFKNPRKSTTVLARELGIPTKIYESACARAMKDEQWPRSAKVKVRRRQAEKSEERCGGAERR